MALADLVQEHNIQSEADPIGQPRILVHILEVEKAVCHLDIPMKMLAIHFVLYCQVAY